MTNKDLQKRISKAANFTWQSIGADILQVAEADSMSRNDVIEAVSDCDYLERYGDDKEAVEAFRALDIEEQHAMLVKAFPCIRYGW